VCRRPLLAPLGGPGTVQAYWHSAVSAVGTFETSRDVRISVAIGGKPDVARAAHFGSVAPEADIWT